MKFEKRIHRKACQIISDLGFNPKIIRKKYREWHDELCFHVLHSEPQNVYKTAYYLTDNLSQLWLHLTGDTIQIGQLIWLASSYNVKKAQKAAVTEIEIKDVMKVNEKKFISTCNGIWYVSETGEINHTDIACVKIISDQDRNKTWDEFRREKKKNQEITKYRYQNKYVKNRQKITVYHVKDWFRNMEFVIEEVKNPEWRKEYQEIKKDLLDFVKKHKKKPLEELKPWIVIDSVKNVNELRPIYLRIQNLNSMIDNYFEEKQKSRP